MPFDTPPVPHRVLSSVQRKRHIADLCAIHQRSVSVVQLQRVLTPQLRDDAERLSQRAGFRMLATVTPDRRGKHALWSQLAEFPNLAADIGFWVEVLSDLVECGVVAVRLARVDLAMCPRLHVDHVSVRCVSTYVGRGTEYVDSADVDRRFLGHAARGEIDERSGLLRSNAMIYAAGSGDVVLLKGDAWPGNLGQGAVHRSPAASPEHPRLVMTLDPLWN